MPSAVIYKLLAIFGVVGIGWAVARLNLLGAKGDGDSDGGSAEPVRLLSNAAFYIFIPALLFRTSVRLDWSHPPWATLTAFFAPMLALMLLIYAWQRHWNRKRRLGVAAPCVRAISGGYGNLVQVGLPLAAALFGEAGLAIHITIVSVHSLLLLTLLTMLVELDLARERQRQGNPDAHFGHTLAVTLRNTLVHPVVLPVLLGLLLNAAGLSLPALADDMLQLLGQAAVPLCLVLIGMSLSLYGVRGVVKRAGVISVIKLFVAPALVLAVGHWGLGLAGLPLAVVVLAAALPVGSNALIFAQRYDTLQAEATAAIVFSTLGFVLTAPLWLAILHAMG
jgi:malonate transporter and related proteins